jgi:hypothetical protein
MPAIHTVEPESTLHSMSKLAEYHAHSLPFSQFNFISVTLHMKKLAVFSPQNNPLYVFEVCYKKMHISC